jgi:hypothetical protein
MFLNDLLRFIDRHAEFFGEILSHLALGLTYSFLNDAVYFGLGNSLFPTLVVTALASRASGIAPAALTPARAARATSVTSGASTPASIFTFKVGVEEVRVSVSPGSDLHVSLLSCARS